QLTRSIPIVVPGSGDPLGVGWVTRLARPGGNVTGFSLFEVSILGKTLALLKQMAPGITRVAFIHNPDNPNTRVYRRTFEDAAGPLAVEPVAIPCTALPTSSARSRAWLIEAVPLFWPRPTSPSSVCARGLSRCSPAGIYRRSIRILPL